MQAHGPHLPVGMDGYTSQAIALATAKEFCKRKPQWHALVAPHIPIGTHTFSFFGTIDCSPTVIRKTIEQWGTSLSADGFQYIMVMVLLIDNYSASDGDLFPYQFKKLRMGTVIGLRSWGGVVGIRGSLPFIDGGDLRKPEFAPFDTEGKWAIEGHGVDPDIVVDNDPAKEYNGEDQQLNKAIEVVMEQLKSYKPLPEIPPFPDKSK